MQTLNTSLHYHFAHRILPQVVQANPREIYSILSGPQRDIFLKDLWGQMGKELKSHETSDGLRCDEMKLADGKSVFIIHMPHPAHVPQAQYVGLAYSVIDESQGPSAAFLHYFTLELAVNGVGNEPAWMFCGWEGGVHINRGMMVDNQVETFRKAIEEVVMGKPLTVSK